MKQDDPYRKKIIIKSQKILAESRELKERHDKLIKEYLKLKGEIEERTARTSTAV